MEFDVIGIDEGQFFPDLLLFAETAANAGKTVVVAALDGTFQRKVPRCASFALSVSVSVLVCVCVFVAVWGRLQLAPARRIVPKVFGCLSLLRQ